MRIDPTLYAGRPADRREANEERCYELLGRLGVAYFRVDHEAAEDIPACEQVEGLLGCGICKNLFLTNRQQTDFYLLIMPGEKPFKTKLLSKQIGTARLSFGGAENFGCHPCRNTTSLRFSTKALFDVILPAMGHAPRFVDLPWVVEE